MTISHQILLMRNFSNRSCRENQRTHFKFGNFFSENRVVYEIMSKNMVEPERPITVCRMRVVCWISKATCEKAHTRTRAPAPNRTDACTRPRTHTHTHKHTQYTYYFLLFHGNNGLANAPQCYVISTLLVLSVITSTWPTPKSFICVCSRWLLCYRCDVSDRDAVLLLANRVKEEVGDVSILVNNAGIMPCHPLLQHTPQQIRKIFDVNVLAHFWVSH